MLALGILAEELVRIGGLCLLVTLCALGCATSVPHVEPRAKSPDASVGPDARTGSDVNVGSDAESIGTGTDYPPPIAIPEIRLPAFGTITTDAEGRLSILPTNEIRNAENEMYGWRIWVGRTS